MKRIILTLVLAGLMTAAAAQHVSIGRAALYSLVLPGAGEFYAGNATRGGFFLGTELLCWFALYRFNQEKNWTQSNYERFATANAGLPDKCPDWVYEAAQNYPSSDDYNRLITQDARNYYLIYQNDPGAYQRYLRDNSIPEQYSFTWNDDDAWTNFHHLRVHKQDMETDAKLAIGAALFNRMVSVVDAARMARRHNRQARGLSGLSLQPDFQRDGLKLNYEFRF
jgi:hypothetical protein